MNISFQEMRNTEDGPTIAMQALAYADTGKPFARSADFVDGIGLMWRLHLRMIEAGRAKFDFPLPLVHV